MPRKPAPWWREDRQAWFVQIARKRYNLGPDKEQAWTRFYELMAKPQKRAVRSDSLAAIIDAFLEWSQKHRSPDTYEWYRYRLQRFIDRYPDLLAADLRPFHVETWVDSYTGLSVTSRRNYLRSVKRCLIWAKKQGYIDDNPIAHLEVPRGESKEVVITSEEFATLLSFVRSQPLADLLNVTWDTGCRPQESLRVEARHVDLANHRWVFQKSESKMKRISRVIYLTDEAMAITQRLMLAHPDGPLFRNSNGRPWTPDSVNSALLAVRVRIGKEIMAQNGETISEADVRKFASTLSPTRTVKGKVVEKNAAELRCEAKRKLTYKRAAELTPSLSLYALRHSWATHALTKGVDPLTVAVLMGHSDPSMLAKTYQHVALNPQHMLDQAKKAAG